jgi:hypothetical protein
MTAKKVKEKDFSAMERIDTNFRAAMYGIKYFISNIGPIAGAHDDEAQKTVESIKNGIITLLSDFTISAEVDERPAKKISIEKEKLSYAANEIVGLVKKYDYAGAKVVLDNELHMGLLLRSSFLMMIAYLDFLISDILHCYYEKYPKVLDDDMVLNLGELKQCADIKEAIQILIDKKVESVLFKNFNNQKMFFEDKLKIRTEDKIINWGLINEACQRRNILAHNNGIVNKRYLKNVTELPAYNKVKIGERLGVRGDYFIQVYSEIIAGGVILAQNCWRKWFKEDLADADATLIDCINRELLQREFLPATRLCPYSTIIEKGSEEARYDLDSLFCKLLKMLGMQEQFTTEIGKLEERATSSKRLATIAALKDEKVELYTHLKNAAKSGEMNKNDIELKAIYSDFNKEFDFKTEIDKIFKYR